MTRTLKTFWMLWASLSVAVFVLPTPGPDIAYYIASALSGWMLFRWTFL